MTVRQRADGDCACGSVATLLQETYEDVYIACERVDRVHRGKNGMHNYEVVQVAKLLGVKLIPTRAYNLDDDDGVLRVRWNDPAKRVGGHYVAVLGGLIYCSGEGMATPWRDYLERRGGRPCTLLRASA